MKLLDGFAFSGYRSFGEELYKIAPLEKINFIIGKNNSGKSNIINFLDDHYSTFLKKINGKTKRDESLFNYLEIDYHNQSKMITPLFSFAIAQQNLDDYIQLILSKNEKKQTDKNLKELIKQILFSEAFKGSNNFIWFTYKYDIKEKNYIPIYDIELLVTTFNEQQWNQLSRLFSGEWGGDIEKRVRMVVPHLIIPPEFPNIVKIPAIRKIGEAGSASEDFDGEGIIERLAKIQNPDDPSDRTSREAFERINNFLRTVLDKKEATLEIPYSRDKIYVHMDNKILPLDSLGTGVHEVVILAVASTILKNSIICIEEPELHMHPFLQRKLVDYLFKNTDNQYFITTHSAHLIDISGCSIFHVSHDSKQSFVQHITETKQRSNICKDLGYKASDILQANCIIWVEGPSDRIYLNYWIKGKDESLIEGIHYSIMFFGGKSFSHLTVHDVEDIEERVDDFISLSKLNRNSVIVFDSDRQKKTHTNLNDTKKRLRDEFNKEDGFAWITKGREIENYLNYSELEEAIKNIHPKINYRMEKDPYTNLLQYETSKGDKVSMDKVRIARYYTDNFKQDYRSLDLEEQINKVCSFISLVN